MNALRRFYDRWIMHPAAFEIAKSIVNEPDRWQLCPVGCVLERDNLPYGVAGVWVANGWFYCQMWRWPQPEIKLGLFGRTIVWIAARGRVTDIKHQRKLEAAKRLAESKREWLKALRDYK